MVIDADFVARHNVGYSPKDICGSVKLCGLQRTEMFLRR